MILQLKNVESAYGLSQILFGVNLEVREGEVCCLLGRNGVGKSTTIKTIMGQVKPKSGEILFEGQNIAGRESFAINRMGVSYVPQGRMVFPTLTVKENVIFGERIPAGTENPWTLERIYQLFPAPERTRKLHGQPYFRRRAADDGYRSRADAEPEGAAAG